MSTAQWRRLWTVVLLIVLAAGAISVSLTACDNSASGVECPAPGRVVTKTVPGEWEDIYEEVGPYGDWLKSGERKWHPGYTVDECIAPA